MFGKYSWTSRITFSSTGRTLPPCLRIIPGWIKLTLYPNFDLISPLLKFGSPKVFRMKYLVSGR